MGGLLVLLFSLSSLYRTAVVQVLTGADAFSSLPSPHYKFLKSIRQQLTRKYVFPEAREGFRRGPENPQDPHHPDLSQSPIPREGLLRTCCLSETDCARLRIGQGSCPRHCRGVGENPSLLARDRKFDCTRRDGERNKSEASNETSTCST